MDKLENTDQLKALETVATTAEPRKKGQSLQSKLAHYALLFDNLSQVPEAKAYAATLGYDEKEIKIGQDLFKSAKAVLETQNLAYGRWRGLVAEENGIKQELHDEYMRHLTFARKAFEGKVEILESLKILGTREKQFDRWSAAVSTFYQNALAIEAVKAELALRMVDEKQLKAAQLKLKTLHDVHMDKIQQKSEYKKLTYQKKLEVEALGKWVGKFSTLARRQFLRDPAAKIVLAL